MQTNSIHITCSSKQWLRYSQHSAVASSHKRNAACRLKQKRSCARDTSESYACVQQAKSVVYTNVARLFNAIQIRPYIIIPSLIHNILKGSTEGISPSVLLYLCRSQRPNGLRQRPSAARLLELRVQILPEAWISVLLVMCVVTYRSLRTADPSSRGVLPNEVCQCVI